MSPNPITRLKEIDRGQFFSLLSVITVLVLIGGITTAYVGLSETDERRGVTPYHSNTDEMTSDIEHTLASSLSQANQIPGESTAVSATESRVEDRIDTQMQIYQDNTSQGVQDYSIRGFVSGYRVAQTDTGATIEDNSGNGNWTIYTSADDSRQVTFRLVTSSLPDSTADQKPAIEIDTANEGRKEYEIYATDGVLTLDGSGSTECEIGVGSVIRIDFLQGIVDESPCSDLGSNTWGDVEGVAIKNGSQMTGGYSVTYNDGAIGSGVNDRGNAGSIPGKVSDPVGHPVVYAVSMDVEIIQTEQTVTRTVNIAPGEQHTPPNTV